MLDLTRPQPKRRLLSLNSLMIRLPNQKCVPIDNLSKSARSDEYTSSIPGWIRGYLYSLYDNNIIQKHN